MTDLDILVDRRRSLELQALLGHAGFKRFSALGAGAYPAVEDYLGFDEASGRLVHLHLHYELVVGEKHLKGFRLPWESELLGSRRFDQDATIYVADPNLELLLLLVRAALKLRLRDQLKPRSKPCLGRDSTREYLWLQARSDPKRVAAFAQKLLGEPAAAALRPLLETPPTLATLSAFRDAAPTLGQCRSYSPLGARARRLFREGLWVLSVLNKRYLHAPRPLRRTVPMGGRSIAFLGSDGSGKSTLLESLNRWLSWKLDVYPVYHGSGDGPASLLRLPLRWGLRLLKRRNRVGRATSTGTPKPKRLNPARVLWALVLAQEKRTKLQHARHARNAGMIVLADRYPQTSVPGFNDGPLLSGWLTHPSALRRRLARWEREPYDQATRYPPDLVVKLRVSPEVAHGRKPEMPLESFVQRVRAVENIDFDTQTVTVDADKSADEVLAEVKRLVWALL